MTATGEPMTEMTEAQAIAEGRLIVSTQDGNGVWRVESYGPSSAEQLASHAAGTCGTTCSHCHQALADDIGEEAAIETMYLRTFGKEMPKQDVDRPRG